MSDFSTRFPLLDKIDVPADLRLLSEEQLPELAKELRQYLLESLNISGGHFGANLGTVELTIALHYVYNTPEDRLVWDVGHQAYPHKILTGRKEQISSIRQHDGLSPFPKRSESIYDAFGVGHSSTSISAALGMAIANKMAGKNNKAVAIIGDGAMTAGMAFEALNHAGHLETGLAVVLNDNNMSISENVGGLSTYLNNILASKFYRSVRESGKKVLNTMPAMKAFVRKTEEHVKGMFMPSTIFEELGFVYLGPIDGHDVLQLVKFLRIIKESKEPHLLHIVTVKGKGFELAETEQIKYHAVNPGYLNETQDLAPKASKPTYSNIFGEWLCDMAEQDPRLVGITPAMREGSDMIRFSELYPERYYDVAIAEQHAVTFAAGLACEGMKPVVAIYSTFLQRAYDQLIHDVDLQNLDVLFALDRAGYVGGDGPTHAGSFDISYLRCLPNMLIMAPSDENECRQMLYTGFIHQGPAAVRYPRGTGPGIAAENAMQAFAIGKAELRRQGKNIAILAFGSMLAPALVAAENLDATVVNMRFIKPLDKALIKSLAESHSIFVTIEENTIPGGAGSAVNELLQQEKLFMPCLNLGLPDTYLEHGDCKKRLAEVGLDASGIVKSVQAYEQSLKKNKS